VLSPGGYASFVTSRHDIDRLQSELGEFFDDLWRRPRFARPRRGFRPALDCFRTEDPAELHVVVELAGVDPEDVHILATETALLLTGVRRRPKAECRVSHYVLEVEYGPFERQIPLPEDVDPSAARATYERGLLTIVLPVAAKPVPRERVAIAVTYR
jgi:HSP20 family protein